MSCNNCNCNCGGGLFSGDWIWIIIAILIVICLFGDNNSGFLGNNNCGCNDNCCTPCC